jgi:hypothetical protein
MVAGVGGGEPVEAGERSAAFRGCGVAVGAARLEAVDELGDGVVESSRGVRTASGKRERRPVHLRYRSVPSTTPERDSFLAKQSCGANRCVSHQVLASSAVGKGVFITVIHSRPG